MSPSRNFHRSKLHNLAPSRIFEKESQSVYSNNNFSINTPSPRRSQIVLLTLTTSTYNQNFSQSSELAPILLFPFPSHSNHQADYPRRIKIQSLTSDSLFFYPSMEATSPNLVKEEKPEGNNTHPASSSTPRPMEGLQDSWPPPFLTKTYDMVDDAGTDQMVSWNKMNNSFVVWDPHSFAMNLLPKHFKHNNFSSFVRQLNTYGFRKVDPDKWEFAHEGFLRGQKHLLMNIKRRRPPTHPLQQQASEACLEVGKYGLDGEIDRLKRDKGLLMSEVIKLRQDQQNSKARVQAMADKLKVIEQKQLHMMTFLARAMQNPSFVDQLAEQKEKRKELQEAISKKRKRFINIVPANVDAISSQLQIQDPDSIYNLVGNDQSAVENLALEVHGLEERENEEQNEAQKLEVQGGEELTEEFWELMFNEMIANEPGTADFDLMNAPK